MSLLSRERWEAAQPVLDAALDLPTARRAAFLDAACAGNDTLRDDVVALLAACEAAGHLLDGSAAEVYAALLDEPRAPRPRRRDGR